MYMTLKGVCRNILLGFLAVYKNLFRSLESVCYTLDNLYIITASPKTPALPVKPNVSCSKTLLGFFGMGKLARISQAS